VEDAKILLGQQAARSRPSDPLSWRDVEFRVFSPATTGSSTISSSGSVRRALRRAGRGDYTESNTRFLLVNRQWSGFICDATCA
jgi:hypothetical protein